MRTRTNILISALKKLSTDIHCEDGVATACIYEGATRIEELSFRLKRAKELFDSNSHEELRELLHDEYP
jgi:hypothetical protein